MAVMAQSIDISASTATENNNPWTFALKGGEVVIKSGNIQFINSGTFITNHMGVGISKDYSQLSILKQGSTGGQLQFFNGAGDTLNQIDLKQQISSDDPSTQVFAFNNGNSMVRHNINRFLLYDTFGNLTSSFSNSSQARGGENISEVVMDSKGGTVVIYTPKIKRNGGFGSKVQAKVGQEFNQIYSSSDRYLKTVSVSDDGDLIALITAGEGTDDEVILVDQFGNEINSFRSDEDLTGVTISEGEEYVTLYSLGRVMVYNLIGGEQLGSASVRSYIHKAGYFPEDNLILVLTGSYSEKSNILSHVEVRAIDVKRREITTKGFSGRLGFNSAITPYFESISSGKYRFVGASRHLTLEVNF